MRYVLALLALCALAVIPGASASITITGTTQTSLSAAVDGLACGTSYTITVQPSGQTITTSTSPCAVQTDYYVDSVNGNDANNGASAATAWRTLGKVNATTLHPGDNVHVAKGSSFNQELVLNASGTAAQHITVFAYGTGANPVINGGAVGVAVNGAYNDVFDLVADGNSFAGFEVSGANDLLRFVTATHNEAGFSLKGSGSTQLHEFTATDNNKFAPDGNSGAWGVLVHSPSNDIGPGTITGSDGASVSFGRDGAAFELGTGAIGNLIHHIQAAHNETFSELDGASATTFSYVYEAPADTSVDTQGKGFVINGSTSSGTTISNATIVERGATSQGFVCYSACSPSILKLRDSIFVADWKQGYAQAAFDNDYNIFSGPGIRQFALGAHDRVVNPQLVSDTNFHLLNTSPAIDTGVVGLSPTDLDGDSVPQGAATDVGADESTLAPPPPPTQFALTVSKAGAGSGTVTSSPAGINCGATCSANFNSGTVVTLTETPTAGSVFNSWSGACSGSSSTCSVTMNAAKGVTTTFDVAPPPPPPPPPNGIQHIAWVFMENHAYSQIIGNASAPYINSLSTTYGLATNFHAESHPSLPNYLAATSGSTWGVSGDGNPPSNTQNQSSIYSQLPGGASHTWMESMPSNCFKSDSGNTYTAHDNPMIYYTNLGTDCANFDTPFPASGVPDLSPKFSFITPNRCHDMHSNSCAGSSDVVKQGDDFLRGFIPALQATPQYQAGNTLLIVTWDEDDGSHGNQVATIVVYPSVSHVSCGTSFTHYSMLRDVEDIFGVSRLQGAATANPMRSCFGLP